MRSCYEHLSSKQEQGDGSYKPYYIKVDDFKLMEARERIESVLEEALDNNIITKTNLVR